MKPYRKFKPFQIRWNEAMGEKGNPYLYRWTFLFFNYSIRIHHWIRSDDDRFFHDHPWNFISIILKGKYVNVTPKGRYPVNAISRWKSNALDRHYLEIPKGGAWTMLFCGRPYHKWGFWKGDKKLRPLQYFYKYKGSAHNTQKSS
jgi:hypothetical protein